MRVRSRENIENARSLGYCQICGLRRDIQVHHIRSKGAGGGDEPENLVLLCAYHHRLVQDHIIRLEDCELLGTRVPGYEELIQRAVDCLQNEQEARWTLGAICAVLVNVLQAQKGDVASQLGCSARYVSELVRTWEAFPTEEARNPELSWQHHRLAASTEAPAEWLARAADAGWSTREMQEAIREAQGEKQEQSKEMKKAERAFSLVREVLSAGGEAAEWLYQELKEAYFGE